MLLHPVLITLVLSVGTSFSATEIDPLSDLFIDFINANQSSWRAGRNFDKDTPLEYINSLMGTIKDDTDDSDIIHYEPEPNIKIPKTFDARVHWPNCTTLSDIRDQGSCGSCWAVAAAACMTDRICINSNKNFYFSDTDILTCCSDCGYGCDGGKLKKAWKYYLMVGVVSGGSYNSKQGCRPYEIAPCDHHTNDEDRVKCGKKVKTPFCQTQCEKTYKISYNDDRHKGTVVYSFNDVKGAQVNILLFGPITSSFSVYQDFINYKSGVYEHVAGKYMGEHSVKIIGCGKENNKDYWLVSNSWNTDWGDNGFFKILRGVNHCGIEASLIVGK